ncbi:terminase large subunit domain-containing protein [Hymenobacter sp. BT491]|uniref:terminase large subunit domain-containing protein n=1 Tax=Hymenobacter sp. BT491 TaxID=2766779 RepID=UPI00165358B5|nr:terminase family protein [Hymenobacter sp. BT491]MBC6988955.1 hypothetical protein [Hymenobacter sp. BT491]
MPTAEITYTRPWVAPYQQRMLDCPARYTVTEASTKAGKTASHIIWLFEQALQGQPGQNFWWVAPVYNQAKIAFARMKQQVSTPGFFVANESSLTLTLPTGAILWFKTAEKPDNLYGDDVYAAVFDEFTRSREEAWFALRSTLTATQGKCKFIGNVKGKKNWGYKMAQKARQDTTGTYAYFKITAYDAVEAGILKQEEIEEAKRDLPEAVFRELYLAEPSEDGSNPFGLTHLRRCLLPTGLAPGPAVAYGIDLAKSFDYAVIAGLNAQGYTCQLDRWQSPWGETKRRILSLPDISTLIDSTGVGDPIVEEVMQTRRRTEGFKFTSQSKQQLMEGLTLAFQQTALGIPSGWLYDELEAFEYVYTRTGVQYAAPAGLHDDGVCALALAWRAYTTLHHQKAAYVVHAL